MQNLKRPPSLLFGFQIFSQFYVGGHRNWFCRKAMLPFGSHQAPLSLKWRGPQIYGPRDRIFQQSVNRPKRALTSYFFKQCGDYLHFECFEEYHTKPTPVSQFGK